MMSDSNGSALFPSVSDQAVDAGENVSHAHYECSGATDEQLRLYHELNWWTEGIIQVVICFIGLCGNTISIPVLMSKSMHSVFNNLLVFLALFDNLYLILSILESIRHEWGVSGSFHYHLFGHALYALHNASLCCSIYMTVVLAMERYLAVSAPVEYHLSIQGGRRWVRIARYVLPVVLLSVAFNVPKFFELRAEDEARNVTITYDGKNITREVIESRIVPTRLRLDESYTFYYQNNARLLVTGIIPFLALVAFNYGIYKAVRRRRSAFGGPSSVNAAHAQHAAEENRQAIMLFAIVIFFLVFNTPRNFLNLYEVITFQQVKEDWQHGCKSLAFWLLAVGTSSHLLLVINSSLNFFLYCVMSTSFRCELGALFTRILGSSRREFGSGLSTQVSVIRKISGEAAVVATGGSSTNGADAAAGRKITQTSSML